MNKDKKPWYLKKRKPAPPSERVHRDRKKEARRTFARGPAAGERYNESEEKKNERDSIQVGGRVGFNEVQEIPERFRDVDFPVELALPWRYELWETAQAQFDHMLESLGSLSLNVISVHATQGWISKDSFLEWGLKTCHLAGRLDAETVTVHPNRSKKPREGHQQAALRHLAEVQRQTTVILSVETFEGKGRIFTIREVMDFGLPMTLDTSHIREDKQIIEIIESYRRNIPVVHLSARNELKQHLPVDRFCLDLVQYLVRLGWAGNIVLEYLPDFHDQLRADVEKVRRIVEGEKRVD